MLVKSICFMCYKNRVRESFTLFSHCNEEAFEMYWRVGLCYCPYKSRAINIGPPLPEDCQYLLEQVLNQEPKSRIMSVWERLVTVFQS
jgi:hypothetical protein